MKQFLQPEVWRNTIANPAALAGLLVDLAPIVGVVFWQWSAATLVLLYWIEKLIIGAVTIGRIALASVGNKGPIAIPGVAFTCTFFVFHYGIFWLAHGGLVLEFFGGGSSWPASMDLLKAGSAMLATALQFGDNMVWVVAIMAVWHVAQFASYVREGGWKGADPNIEMLRPYGRVVALHIAVFSAGAALSATGNPAIGLVLLVIARAAFGVVISQRTRSKAPLTEAVAT